MSTASYARNVESLINSESGAFSEGVDLLPLPPEYQARPILYRGFNIYPELKVNSQYNTNIYAQKNNEQSDIIVQTQPSIMIQKNYGAWSLGASGRANIERFMSFNKDDKEEFRLEAGGNYEPNSRWTFPFNVSYNRVFKNRGTPQTASVLESPTRIETRSATTGFVRNFNRLTLRLLGKYSDFQLSDGVTQQTGQTVSFSDNDRSSYGGNMRLSYLFPRSMDGQSGHVVFLDIDAKKNLYDNPISGNGASAGIKRDNTSYNAILGFSTAYKGLIEASAGAGILSRVYDSKQLKNNDSLDLMASIRYSVTPKFLLDFQIDRHFSQYSDTDSGFIETNYELSGNYEIYHNLLWSNALSYDSYDFLDANRFDKDYKIRTALKYYLNERLNTQLGVTYQTRESTDANREFDRMIFMLSLTGNL